MSGIINKDELFDVYEKVMLRAQRSIAVVDFNMHILFTNQAAVETYEYTLEEALGRPLHELIFGEETNVPPIIAAFEAVARGEEQTFEVLLYSKSKRKIWVRAHLIPLFDSNNKPDRCCVYAVDITSEKNIEYKLSVVESNYQEVLDTTYDVFLEIDIRGYLTFINNTWTKLTGYSVQESLGRYYLDIFPTADKETSLNNFKKLLSKEIPLIQRDIKLLHKDGYFKWFNLKTELRISLSGDTLGFKTVLRDIDEEKRLSNYSQILSNNITDLVGIHKQDSSFEYVSPSCKELLGYEQSELVGVQFNFIHPDDLDKVIANANDILSGKNNPLAGVNYRCRKKNGEYIWVETTSKYFLDDYSGEMKFVTSTRISEERMKAERELNEKIEAEKRLNQLKSDFVRFVSHEFRSPLAVIKAIVEYQRMVLDRDEKDGKLVLGEDLNTIEKEITGLTLLMDDVLTLEKVESGSLTLKFERICIEILLKRRILSLNRDMLSKNCPELNIEGKEVGVMGDVKYLALVFNNIIDNALKYSDKTDLPPVVTISYQADAVNVSVKDYGIGIPKKNQDKIFNTFFRAENVGEIEGTGLGLSIVKKIVGLHNGTITFSSEENVGTEMIVTLPACKVEIGDIELKPAKSNTKFVNLN